MTNKIEAKNEITKIYDLAKPTEAVAMATLLQNLVVQQKLAVNIKGKNYAMVEAWQMAGFLTGTSVMIDEPKNLSTTTEIKYSATARIFQGEKLVGVGYALCSSKEFSKKGFDEYAILSMAQTRAIGKAYRNKIGWIMKLAGYEPTPSEEMQSPVAGAEKPKVSVEKVTSALMKIADVAALKAWQVKMKANKKSPYTDEEKMVIGAAIETRLAAIK